jgi:HSP20 family protein
MYQSLFPRDVFAELDRLQREMRESFDLSPASAASAEAAFPRSTSAGRRNRWRSSLSLPGSIRRRWKSTSTAAADALPASGSWTCPPRTEDKAAVHINERFSGRFRRVVSLSDDRRSE